VGCELCGETLPSCPALLSPPGLCDDDGGVVVTSPGEIQSILMHIDYSSSTISKRQIAIQTNRSSILSEFVPASLHRSGFDVSAAIVILM